MLSAYQYFLFWLAFYVVRVGASGKKSMKNLAERSAYAGSGGAMGLLSQPGAQRREGGGALVAALGCAAAPGGVTPRDRAAVLAASPASLRSDARVASHPDFSPPLLTPQGASSPANQRPSSRTGRSSSTTCASSARTAARP